LTLDPPLIAISTLFSVSIDVDHVFQLTGLSYLPRPAHSLVFLAALLGSLWLRHRRRDLVFVSASAFLGHITLDTGRFPLLSPIYLHYFTLPDWADTAFIIAAVALNATYAYQHWNARRSKNRTPQEAKTGLSGSPRAGRS